MFDLHLGDRGAGRVGLEPQRARVGEQRDVGELQRRSDRDHLGVGLGVDQAGEPVAVHAANAGRERHVVLGQHDPAGGVKRPVAGPRQIVVELLDARLVRDRRVGIGRARGRIDGILAARAVDLVEILGARVVGLEIGVGDRPGGRDAVLVPQLPEVALAQAVELGAVHLRGPPHVVVNAGLKRLAVLVVPGVRRDVAALDEHVLRAPVLLLRGSHPPRSSSRMRLPVAASSSASVPPPAPVPMMIRS